MVILAFVTELSADGAGEGWPAMNLASNCWAASAAQQAAGATGLLDCVGDGFYNQITACQSQGKKVLLSLGGSTGNLAIPSDEKAVEAAHTLWSLFLGGSNATTSPIRPFGSVVLDGIDLGKHSTLVQKPEVSSQNTVSWLT
jgi:chitinase